MKVRNIAALIFIFLALWSVSMPVAAFSEATIPEETEILNVTEMPDTVEMQETVAISETNNNIPTEETTVDASEESNRQGLDASTITAIASAITAIAAIITPNVASIMKARSEERKARFEQYSPQIYIAIDEFTTAYSKFHRLADYTNAGKDYQAVLDDEVSDIYKNFCAAAYKVISLIPSRDVREQIIILLKALEKEKYVSDLEDSFFHAILENLAHMLSP